MTLRLPCVLFSSSSFKQMTSRISYESNFFRFIQTEAQMLQNRWCCVNNAKHSTANSLLHSSLHSSRKCNLIVSLETVLSNRDGVEDNLTPGELYQMRSMETVYMLSPTFQFWRWKGSFNWNLTRIQMLLLQDSNSKSLVFSPGTDVGFLQRHPARIDIEVMRFPFLSQENLFEDTIELSFWGSV